ncbi:hypothetical protein Syun_002127 [Stephania yunnanensis]|uniref:Cytochrome P450 n=1 Tax=Stephania yunnanensis TaxID=152371 RepID=A0AAP0Q6X2_9MAGN
MEPYILLLVQAIATAVLVTFMLHQLWCLRRKVRKITKSSSFNGKGAVVNKNNAPEPPGAWPIIGHLPLLVSAKQPHRAFAALAEKYGPAFMVRMGMSSPMLIVSSREVAKECYTAKDHVFATRLSQAAGKLMAYDHSVMGFTPFGTYWREIRKIATVELFSARRIGMLKPDLDYIIRTWLDEHRAKGDQMRGDAINNTRDFLDVLVMMEKSGQFSSAIKDIDTTIKALALTQLVVEWIAWQTLWCGCWRFC